jgi:outer membrane protein
VIRLRLSLAVLAWCLVVPLHARAQAARGPTEAPAVFTLDEALQYAVAHYPAVSAALEYVNTAAADAGVARAAYLPRLDSVWQSNRATANNVFGQVLPQSLIPAMSGPVLPSMSSQSVWGSAAGALFSWEAFDFGLRHAAVEGAEAAVTRARAAETLTRLEVQSAVGAAFLDALAAQRAVVAVQADVDRRGVLARIVHVLVDNQLRAGAEASRADAERAAADTRLIRARETAALAEATMARVLGVKTGAVAIDAARLLDRAPASEVVDALATAHPLAQAHQADVDLARAQAAILERTDRPRVYVQSSVFARGSGANPSGQLDGGVDGLGLDRANWAAGVQVQFPNLFDVSSLRARKAAAAATARAESALLDEAVLTVTNQQRAAAVMVEAARAVAANMPLQLAAAQQTEAQARARYQAGLTSVVEAAEAQSLLAQAEVQDEISRVDVWRALLSEAVAQGSLAPFITLLHPPDGGR